MKTKPDPGSVLDQAAELFKRVDAIVPPPTNQDLEDNRILQDLCQELEILTKKYQKSFPDSVISYKFNSLLDAVSFQNRQKTPEACIVKFQSILDDIKDHELDVNYGRGPIRLFKEGAYDLLCGALVLPALYRAANNWSNYGSLFRPIPEEAVERFREVLANHKHQTDAKDLKASGPN